MTLNYRGKVQLVWLTHLLLTELRAPCATMEASKAPKAHQDNRLRPPRLYKTAAAILGQYIR